MIISGTTYENGNLISIDVGKIAADNFSENEAVKFVPEIHARWILEREPNGRPYCFHCSNCDNDFHNISHKSVTNYCHDCGAKMDMKVYEE